MFCLIHKLTDKGMKLLNSIISVIILFASLGFICPDLQNGMALSKKNFKLQISPGQQDPPVSKKVKKAMAKDAANHEKEQKAYEIAKAKDMKHRMELQTPLTRKRMQESKKIAEQNNNHYHKSIWQKLFGRK